MSSVLFDVPGPRAVLRHRLYGVVGTLLILAFLGFAGWKLWEADQITPDAFRYLTVPSIVEGLLEALGATLSAAAIAILLAIVFGAVFAVGKMSPNPVLRWPSVAVIEFFRAIPVLLLILGIFLTFGSTLGSFWALVLALMLYNGSVLAEIFRAGVEAVPRGQVEAGFAIGLHRRQVLRLIQAPQAISTMLPAMISQCVVALKDTALGYVIGAPELARESKYIFTSFIYNNPIAVGLMLMAVYIVINYSLSQLAEWLESRMRREGKEAVHTDAQIPT